MRHGVELFWQAGIDRHGDVVAVSDMQIGSCMPLVGDIPHYQGVIKLRASSRKFCLILKVAGLTSSHRQTLERYGGGFQVCRLVGSRFFASDSSPAPRRSCPPLPFYSFRPISISMDYHPAFRTSIDAGRKRDLVSMAAPRAILRRVRWIYFDHFSSSLFRFEDQDHYELSPTSVTDAFRQMMVPHHSLDVQIFYFDALVLRNQLSCFFEMKISPLSFHLQMLLRQPAYRFLSPFAPLDSTRDSTLRLL